MNLLCMSVVSSAFAVGPTGPAIDATAEQIAEVTEQSEQVQAAIALQERAVALVRMNQDRDTVTAALLRGCPAPVGWAMPLAEEYFVKGSPQTLIPACFTSCTCVATIPPSEPAPSADDTSVQQ